MLKDFVEKYRDQLPALSPEQVAALEAHLDLLERWNRTINLTAIKGKEEAIAKHVGESLFLSAYLPEGALRMCDVGSGGGFPGIPVAIARPDCKVTLVESDVRKGVFLREASRKLANVTVLTQRFELVPGEFDWLISRAVNLFATIGGPKCERVAFLGSEDWLTAGNGKITKRTRFGRFQWQRYVVPWDAASFLYIGFEGDVSRETSADGL